MPPMFAAWPAFTLLVLASSSGRGVHSAEGQANESLQEALEQERCPYRIAVVTALMGNREGRFSINSVAGATHTCMDYFAFVPSMPVSADGWNVVLPNASKTWGNQFRQIQRGNRNANHSERLYKTQPFDPLALGYTNEHDGPFIQKLDEIMLPRFAKTQMMHFDVLAEYEHFLWVDASVQLSGDVFGRLKELLPEGTEVSFMDHPVRKTVLQEMKAAINEQPRYFEMRDMGSYGFLPEWEHYRSSGFKDNVGLFWTCLFYARRTANVKRMLDSWWYLLRRWEPLDQTTLPYAIWKTEKESGGIVRPNFAKRLCYMAIGNPTREACCRRCGKDAAKYIMNRKKSEVVFTAVPQPGDLGYKPYKPPPPPPKRSFLPDTSLMKALRTWWLPGRK